MGTLMQKGKRNQEFRPGEARDEANTDGEKAYD